MRLAVGVPVSVELSWAGAWSICSPLHPALLGPTSLQVCRPEVPRVHTHTPKPSLSTPLAPNPAIRLALPHTPHLCRLAGWRCCGSTPGT